MTIEKLGGETPDITKQNIARLAELFPECVTEGPAGTASDRGEPVIDWDLIKQALSDHLVEGPQERYRLDWPGKRQALLTANAPIDKTLRPMRDQSVDFETTRNLFIEGDNLDALKLLQETYLGKIKMIYLDPPYNTGQDFLYRDDFSQSETKFRTGSGITDELGVRLVANATTNGRFHSDWLSMMYPRLKLARNLLKENGVLFVSLDENESANCKKILDEIFGEKNFIGNITWESKTKSQNTKESYNKLQPKTENILVYTKSTGRRFTLIERGKKEYPLSDTRGSYREYQVEMMAADGIRGRSTMVFPILGVKPEEGKQWKLGVDTINDFIAREDIFLKGGRPTIKMRPGDESEDVYEPFWGFFPKSIGTAESAKKELTRLFATKSHGFETVKPVELIQRLVFHTTDPDDVILDFFLGSGTTAHAVFLANAIDNGGRRFIGVQLPEPIPESDPAFEVGFKTISDIAKERIRLAAKSVGMKSRNLDTGFRAFRIDNGNFEDTRVSPQRASQDALVGMISHIKDDRSDEDLLFGALLRWGVDITLPIKKGELAGRAAWFVDPPTHGRVGSAVVACFARPQNGKGGIDTDLADAIAALKPLRVLFRDDGFATDAVKENVASRLKQLSPDTTLRVL